MARVVTADEMDDETFCKHVQNRHADDVALGHLQYLKFSSEAFYASFRAYHARIHALGLPGQFEHRHVEE